MARCVLCGDSGVAVTGRFCSCAIGKVQQRVEKSKGMAEKKKTEEVEKEKKRRSKREKQLEFFEEKEKPEGIEVEAPCRMFDWVIVKKGHLKGVIGPVIEIDENTQNVKVEARKKLGGSKVSGKGRFSWADVELYVLPKDEDDLRALIDLALVTGDKDWFKELVEQLP